MKLADFISQLGISTPDIATYQYKITGLVLISVVCSSWSLGSFLCFLLSELNPLYLCLFSSFFLLKAHNPDIRVKGTVHCFKKSSYHCYHEFFFFSSLHPLLFLLKLNFSCISDSLLMYLLDATAGPQRPVYTSCDKKHVSCYCCIQSLCDAACLMS